MTLVETFKMLNHKLDTVENLVKLGELTKENCGKITKNGFTVTPIFDKGASIVIASAEKKGDTFPTHYHSGIIQYLICFKGSFLVDFVDTFGFCKYLSVNDCAQIPSNKKHKITSLEDGSQLIGICIPVESAYLVEGEKNNV